MIYVKFKREFRFRHSPKFRGKYFYKSYDHFVKNGLLAKERDFVLEYNDEISDIAYTYRIFSYFAWILSFPMLLLNVTQLHFWGSVISMVFSIALRVFAMKLYQEYQLSLMAKDLSKSVYEGLIAEKYNL